MSKSRARLLAELLNSTGLVKRSKSALAGADEVIDLDSLPTITNAKLENSSISIAGHSTALGGTVTLNTGDIGEHTNYKYYTDARADARITNAGSANWNTAYGWGDHASGGYRAASESLYYKPTREASGSFLNLNTATVPGIYRLHGASSHTGHPTGSGYGFAIVLDNSDVHGHLLLDRADDGRLWIRAKTTTSFLTTDWNQVWSSADFADNSSTWDTAYGWGNHASQSYITNSTASLNANKITSGVLNADRVPSPANGDWWNGGCVKVATDGVMEVGKYLDFHTADSGGNVDYDLRVTASAGALTVGGTIAATDGNSTNWNTAYGWGNHASQGYATLASPALTGTPTAPTATAGTNTTQIATTAFVGTAVSNLVDSSPGTLNTLNELAAALGDDENFSTTVTDSIATKLPLAGGTMTGALNAGGGITGLTLSNGISGNNFNITGVNQLTINDPGEGIVFGGGSTTMSLAIVDDATDRILRYSGTGAVFDVQGNITVSGTVDGRDVATDGAKLDGIATSANNYVLPFTNNSANWNTAYTYSQVGHVKVDGTSTLTGGSASYGDRTAMLWMRGKTGDSVNQINVQGAAIEFGQGGTLDATPAFKFAHTGILTATGSILVPKITATAAGMSTFATNMSSEDDYVNSPISIRERGLASAGDGEDRDGPNLNFHWAARVSNSLWMNASGHLAYGSYSSTGIPSANGTFRAGAYQIDGTTVIDSTKNIFPYQIRASGGDDTPAGTQFSNVIKGQGNSRTVYFDGYSSSVSTWYGVGNNPYAAIDITEGIVDIWLNPSSGSWHNVADFSTGGLRITYGERVSIDSSASAYFQADGGTDDWKYLSLQTNGTTNWDIATKNNELSGALQFRPGGGPTNRTYMDTSGNWIFGGTITAPHVEGTIDFLVGSNYGTTTNPDRLWISQFGTGQSDIPGSYHDIINLSSSSTHGVQIASGYGASSGGLYMRTRSDNNSAPAGTGLQAWNKLWHSNNDGANSGLHADLLDGLHAASFIRSDTADTASGAITFTNVVTIDHNTSNMLHIKPTNGGPWAINIERDDLGSSRVFTHNYGGTLGWVFEHTPYDYNGGSPTKFWSAGNDGPSSGLDADTLDGEQGSYYYSAANPPPTYSKYLRSDVSDTVSGTLTFGSGSGFDLATFDIYGSVRVIRNNKSGSDGMYIGYLNTNSGPTRIFGGGQGSGGIYVTGSGANDVKYNNSSTFWHAGNDGSGSGLDADTLDGYQKSEINPAHSHYRWTGISASGTTARRFVIMRLYGCPAHWDSNWQDIHFKVWSESYEATNLKYELCGDYNGGNANTMFQLRLKDAGGSSEHSRFRLVLGTPVDAGWDHSGQNTYYVDVYAEASHYMNFSVAADFYSAGFNVNTLPTSGGATSVVYSSPSVSNITAFIEAKEHSYFANHKIWNDGNHGSASGLDADTVDTLHASSFLRSDATDTATGSITFDQATQYFRKNDATNYTNGSLMVESYGGASSIAAMGFHISGQLGRMLSMNNTGTLSWNDDISISGSYTRAGNAVWDAGNDGSGSGLDADTVDGLHYVSHLGLGKRQTITVYGDTDKYYPILISGNAGHISTYKIHRAYSEHGPNDWYTASHKGGLSLMYNIMGAAGWGGYPTRIHVIEAGEIYSSLLGGIALTAHTMKHVVWLRGGGSGGGRYHIDSNTDFTAVVSSLSTDSHYKNSTDGWYSYDHSNAAYDVTVNYRTLTQRNTAMQSEIFSNMDVYYGNGKVNHQLHGAPAPSKSYIYSSDNYVTIPSSIDISSILNFYNRNNTTKRIYFNTDGDIYATGNITAYSDIALKENIEVIPNALEKVDQIRGVTFTRKDDTNNKRYSGVIAQEIEKVLPEVVETTDEGTKSVAYGNMVGLLIEAVKELKQEVEDLKTQLKEI